MPDVVDQFIDLEFTTIEISLRENGTALSPSRIDAEFEKAVHFARGSHRLEVCSYDVHIDAEGEQYFEQFGAVCRLGKATKSCHSYDSILRTRKHRSTLKLNACSDWLKSAELEGVRVAMKSQIGRLSEDPDTVKVLCDNVKGLGLTLDPSHYHLWPLPQQNLDKIMPLCLSRPFKGLEERQIASPSWAGRNRIRQSHFAACQSWLQPCSEYPDHPMPEIDQRGELRKLRLLLDTLL